MRLDKFLSDMQVGTRSEVKRLIRQGNVQVDGACIVSPNQQINPNQQKICCCGKELHYQKYVYYMLYKPKDCVTAKTDAYHKTVMDYIEDRRKDLAPAGRLDLDTEGLLLITNDGMLSHNLLSPAKHVEKVYEAEIDGPLTQEDIEAFSTGLDIGDETKTKPAKLMILDMDRAFRVQVVITEGRYHQVKRMFQALGRQVVFLKRTAMGSLKLDETLLPGEYRNLTEQEVCALKGHFL